MGYARSVRQKVGMHGERAMLFGRAREARVLCGYALGAREKMRARVWRARGDFSKRPEDPEDPAEPQDPQGPRPKTCLFLFSQRHGAFPVMIPHLFGLLHRFKNTSIAY